MRSYFYRFYPAVYKLIQWYFRKPRYVKKRGIKFLLHPGIFHPGLYHSTDVLLDFIIQQDLKSKRILELGCGSGFISMYLAMNYNAEIFASDLNLTAVQALKENCVELGLRIRVFHSNLFDDIPENKFDFILINPPYYKGVPVSDDELAFYAGSDFEYFHSLFKSLPNYMKADGKAVFIFSENVELDDIHQIARKYKIELSQTKHVKVKGEKFGIFLLEKD